MLATPSDLRPGSGHPASLAVVSVANFLSFRRRVRAPEVIQKRDNAPYFFLYALSHSQHHSSATQLAAGSVVTNFPSVKVNADGEWRSGVINHNKLLSKGNGELSSVIYSALQRIPVYQQS